MKKLLSVVDVLSKQGSSLQSELNGVKQRSFGNKIASRCNARIHNDVDKFGPCLKFGKKRTKSDIVKILKLVSRETRMDCWGRTTSNQGCTNAQDLFKF